MQTRLIQLLNEDHRKIGEDVATLLSGCDTSQVGDIECFERFRLLKAQAIAQFKAEEFVVYAHFEESRRMVAPSVRNFILEGYEEHDLLELMLKEMGQAEEITDVFRAKLRVFKRLLDAHLARTARELMPGLQKCLDEDQEDKLATAYLRERDMIFAKRSGQRHAPASVFHPRTAATH